MKINIINKNDTSYHIVHSVNSTEAERYACMELLKYIYLSTNTLKPVFSDKCMKRSKEIIIGSARDSQVSLELAGMSKEAFIIKEKDEEI